VPDNWRIADAVFLASLIANLEGAGSGSVEGKHGGDVIVEDRGRAECRVVLALRIPQQLANRKVGRTAPDTELVPIKVVAWRDRPLESDISVGLP